MENTSLYHLTRSRILDHILAEIRAVAPYFILIVDKRSLGILNSIATVLDLTERGVTVIEQLEKSRKPIPDVDALYFLTPKDSVARRLIEDYKGIQMYRHAHLFFTADVTESLMRSMANSSLFYHVKTFKEANCDFKVIGQDIFSLERPGILGNLYNDDSDSRAGLMILLARQISALCTVLKELPVICFQATSPQARELGLEIEQQIENIYRKIPDQAFNDNRATLIILDRKFDLATPLAHDVHYEAMLRDSMRVSEDGNITYETADNSNAQSKNAVLNEIDQLWTKYRYEEIDEVQSILSRDLAEFRVNNQDIEQAQQQQEIRDVKLAAKVVSSLGEYQETVSRFGLHSSLVDKLLSTFVDSGIKDITEIEQILLTGIDTQKNEVKEDKIIDKIVRLLPNLPNNWDKTRLAMLAVICLDLKERDRKLITENLKTSEMMTITKLGHLGVELQGDWGNKKSQKRLDKESVKLLKRKIDKIDKIFCYAVPKISEIIENAVNNQLDPNLFEYGRKGGPSFIENKDATGVSLRKKPVARSPLQKKRVIIFVLGGLSYAEFRFVKQHPEAHVIIGGSRVMTPKEFVEDIENVMTKYSLVENNEDLDHQEIHLDLDFR